MNDRLNQLNIAVKKALQIVVLKVIRDSSLIVTDVLLDPSLKHGKVWVNGNPAQINTANKSRSDIQDQLMRHVKLRYTPHLEFVGDDAYLERMDSLFEQVVDK